MIIYFGGTFAGNKMSDLLEKRSKLIEKLKELELHFDKLKILDPLRNKTIYNDIERPIEEVGMDFSPNEIVHRDLDDINKCNLVILNMTSPSIGSSCELMYANLHKKIIIIITENPYVYNHPWIKSLSTKILNNIDETIEYIKNFLI